MASERDHIHPRLARSLAGHVSAGLAPGDDNLRRAYGALTAIGLMLRTATDDAVTQSVLDMIGEVHVTADDFVDPEQS